jgi:hypothetical protein
VIHLGRLLLLRYRNTEISGNINSMGDKIGLIYAISNIRGEISCETPTRKIEKEMVR